jgi:hypothetical protein
VTAPNSSTPTREREGDESESANTILPRIGASVDAQLDATLWGLVGGSIELSDCTPAIQDLWAVAAEQGRKSATREDLERLTYERDLWYACYANGWTPGEYMRRRTAALWAEASA